MCLVHQSYGKGTVKNKKIISINMDNFSEIGQKLKLKADNQLFISPTLYLCKVC